MSYIKYIVKMFAKQYTRQYTAILDNSNRHQSVSNNEHPKLDYKRTSRTL